uniref:Uncharacterized protein n=1 Tax=Ipomoea trifida TaxID=35884 RepID=A0A8Y8_IPOTF|nr:hypothetical protein [Ipomoea trifida]
MTQPRAWLCHWMCQNAVYTASIGMAKRYNKV